MRLHPFFLTPIGQAVRSTLVMASFGLAIRYGLGAVDSDFRNWSLVVIAPLVGLFIYLQASGRESAVAAVLFGIGTGGVGFWILAIWSGGLPVTAGGDWLFIVFILAIPVACVGYAVRIWRRLRSTVGSTSTVR